jgi:hypothetical protein
MRKYFIDTGLLKLEHLEKLDETGDLVKYFYPCIDPYLPPKEKQEEIFEKIKRWERDNGFKPKVNLNKKEFNSIINSNKYEGRFSKVYSPFIKNFGGNNFISSNGSIAEGAILLKDGMKYIIPKVLKEKCLETESTLKKIFPDFSPFNKDFHVLATVISCDPLSSLIRTFMGKEDGKEHWDINTGQSVDFLNDDGYKNFLSLDTKGLFTNDSIERIEKEFGNIRICSAKSIEDLIMKIK